MGSEKILVVDDDVAVARVLAALLTQQGYEVRTAHSADQAMLSMQSRQTDVVLSDVRMPGMDGIELVRKIQERLYGVPVILLTAHGTVAMAVEAMKAGARDFLQKPFDKDEVLFAVSAAIRSTDRESAAPPTQAHDTVAALGIDPLTKEIESLLLKAAKSDATVLLSGESGVGKEVAARIIHERSARKTEPFIAVHCGAIPETLLESELFGYEKGAFTGAVQRKPGRVELAAGGTLLLDEIGDISLAVQVKLLRLLQEKEFQRVGGTTVNKADVRFISASHRDLAAMVRAKTFREDLYFRLNVLPIEIAPLRERQMDIVWLAERFLSKFSASNARPMTLTDDAKAMLTQYAFPGNIRELQNMMERLSVLSDEVAVGPRTLSLFLAGSETGTPSSLDAERSKTEREVIKQAILRSQGNRSQAARVLGISRRTLYNKLTELNLGGEV